MSAPRRPPAQATSTRAPGDASLELAADPHHAPPGGGRSPRDVAEQAARTSYGRLVALLAASTGDVERAEDLLADALERALATWPQAGIPERPEAWLLAVARNRLRDLIKSAAHRHAAPPDLSAEEAALEAIDLEAIPDRRLALLFVCAHPAIAPAVRTPLMLQTVLGFDARAIGRAFAMREGAMSQRLVRAKRKIREARIPFVVPGRSTLAERLPPVLEAIYGCCALADRSGGANAAEEARYLATLLAELLGDEPEAWSLAALITLVSARALFAERYIPLEEQDPASWDRTRIAAGEAMLQRAERPGSAPGRFQLEAAIQAVHCDRLRTGRIDWQALRTLYAALVAIAPSVGARVAQAAVVGRTDGAAAGLALLETLPPERERFQPWHATRADLLARLSRRSEAIAAYEAASRLTDDPAVRTFLRERAARLHADRAR